jgi:hypothetical protein
MTLVASAPASSNVIRAPFKVAPQAGGHNGTVSRQWANRPGDQRFLSLADLKASVAARAANARQTIFESDKLVVRADRNDADKLEILTPDGDMLAPTHWSFGQLATLVGAPASYLRKLPAFLSAVNLQHGLMMHDRESVKTYADTTTGELRAATGPDYGRIFDRDVVDAVMRIAGNGTGDTHWKIPGVLDWSSNFYNPFVDPTADTTTLYASDRDVFMFLVDDTRPFSIGKLPNGDDDLVFRGFYAWNSEVGSTTAGVATFLLRAVCMNRNLWGVENFSEIKIRHSKNGPARFANEVRPALETYANASPAGFIAGINAAKAAKVASNDDERRDFLKGKGFSGTAITKILTAVENEEQTKAESVWDFVQGITAVARSIPNADSRVELERKAGAMLKAAARRA